MKVSFMIVIASAAAALSAGSIQLDRPLPIGGTDDLLQYDDGTANWLTWGGLYRGVWFNLQDFGPGMPGGHLVYLEYWFFHHASYPWDISSFYAEVYDGDAAAPTTQLNQTSVTAVHYSPVHASFSWPGIEVGQNFWVLNNSEMSAGGWPSILGDNTPSPVSHSFFSDDFIVWEPWIINGSTANDYFTRANEGVWPGLDESTWGSIKTLF
jgi:hypothetical protein